MSTAVAKLVRHLSADDLHRYFAFRTIDTTDIAWQAKDAKLRKSVIALIADLSEAKRTSVFLDADAILELAGEAGDLAMVDATGSRAAVLEAFEQIDSAEGRALWLFINQPEAFQRAIASAISNGCRTTREMEFSRVVFRA